MIDPGGGPSGARIVPRQADSGKDIRLRIWPEEEFLGREADYRELLSRSNADPLFMSWEWLVAWWRLHKDPFHLQLKAFSAEAEDGRVLGLAPMTARTFRHGWPGIAGTRLEPLGNLVREGGAALTEYVTFPVDRSKSSEISGRLARFMIADPDWDDLCLSFVPMESDTWRSFVEVEARSAGAYVRAPDHMLARRIDLKEGFSAVLHGLGAKTRLRVYNGRKRLAQIGPVEFVFANGETFESCMAVLDRLHVERWGEPALVGLRGRLYRELAERGLEDGSLALSYLAVGGRAISAALNLRVRDREYGIQFAVSKYVPKGVSPGYLHLGFMLERCCKDGVRFFDFLAGPGGEGDYRGHFRTLMTCVGSVQIIRSRRIAALYRTRDRFRDLSDWFRQKGRGGT